MIGLIMKYKLKLILNKRKGVFLKIIIPNLIFLILLSLSSCGVYSLTGGDIPANAKTFSVAQFTNQAASVNPNLAQVFSDGLRTKFTSETKLKQISDTGDFAFSGYIITYGVAPASIKSGDVAQLNRLTIGVYVKFNNKIDPKRSFEKTFTEYDDFDVSKTLADVETTLDADINKKLIQDIYNAAVMNW